MTSPQVAAWNEVICGGRGGDDFRAGHVS
jgi:hypothetical protein